MQSRRVPVADGFFPSGFGVDGVQRKRDFNEFFYLSHATYYPSYIFSAFSIRAAMLNFELSTEKSGGLWKGFFR